MTGQERGFSCVETGKWANAQSSVARTPGRSRLSFRRMASNGRAPDQGVGRKAGSSMDELADHHGVAPALCKQWPASPFLAVRQAPHSRRPARPSCPDVLAAGFNLPRRSKRKPRAMGRGARQTGLSGKAARLVENADECLLDRDHRLAGCASHFERVARFLAFGIERAVLRRRLRRTA